MSATGHFQTWVYAPLRFLQKPGIDQSTRMADITGKFALRQSTRPSFFDTRNAWLRATAPAVAGS